jgi:hypothetical protein
MFFIKKILFSYFFTKINFRAIYISMPLVTVTYLLVKNSKTFLSLLLAFWQK